MKGQHVPHYVLLMDFIAKEEKAESTLLNGKNKVGVGRSDSESDH